MKLVHVSDLIQITLKMKVLLLLLFLAGVNSTNTTVNNPLKFLETLTELDNWRMVLTLVKDHTHLLQLIKNQNIDSRNILPVHVLFTLYRRNGPKRGVRVFTDNVKSLEVAGFDWRKPVVFVTHGFLSNANEDWVIEFKNAQLYAEDCNLITIDWSECANTFWYPRAKECTITAGRYLSLFIRFLNKQGSHPSRMHLLGHSLGAHLVAQVSRSGQKVARITGWDPAGPMMGSVGLEERLDPSDATVVDVIHTNNALFGFDAILGHYDFFPNGGDDQPGCRFIGFVCDHSSSYYYYIQSLYHAHKYPSYKCKTINDAQKGTCFGPVAYMGRNAVNGAPGIYYTKPDRKPTGSPQSLASTQCKEKRRETYL